jgi:phosphoesterase RecJ-like protein
VLVGTHLNPDGDAVGCAIAMSIFLDQLGVKNHPICHSPVPANLRFLPQSERLSLCAPPGEHDLGIVLDLESLKRLGSVRESFERCRRMIVIDHHVPHEAPGDLRIVDTTAPATAAILVRLLRACSADITPDMATCLLAGLVTDTGSFRYQNTTAESLATASFLLERGGDIVQIGEEVYHRKPMTAILLQGRLIANLRTSHDGRFVWSLLRQADFLETGANDENSEGLVHELLAVETATIAALIREPSPNKVRCSLRSRGACDVAAVAREFGGGGHVNAAGCTFDLPIDEAEKLLVGALQRCLES